MVLVKMVHADNSESNGMLAQLFPALALHTIEYQALVSFPHDLLNLSWKGFRHIDN
jgi:hypothetical protein